MKSLHLISIYEIIQETKRLFLAVNLVFMSMLLYHSFTYMKMEPKIKSYLFQKIYNVASLQSYIFENIGK